MDSNAYDQSKRMRTAGDYTHTVYATSPFHPSTAAVWAPHGYVEFFSIVFSWRAACVWGFYQSLYLEMELLDKSFNYFSEADKSFNWNDGFSVTHSDYCFWIRYMTPAPPPYDPYTGYAVPPVPMPAPTPVPAPSSYAPVQVLPLRMSEPFCIGVSPRNRKITSDLCKLEKCA